MKQLSIEQCAAQVFIFYVAGFESSSATTSYCLYELCKNPALMKRLQDEIDTTLKKYNGEISYDCIQEMQFLELCFAETIRMYPALPILNRECTKEYQIPGSDYKIEKGTSIIISLLGIHRDPKYFPEPDKFSPDRFAEATKNYVESAYIPFGDGPRNCIGNLLSWSLATDFSTSNLKLKFFIF
jgi:cytochrome P450 family 6